MRQAARARAASWGMDVDDRLVAWMALRLEIDFEYVEYVLAGDAERVQRVRERGRRAGALFGRRVQTSTARAVSAWQGVERVQVVVRLAELTSEEEERLDARTAHLLRELPPFRDLDLGI
jgi:hypothetical protein